MRISITCDQTLSSKLYVTEYDTHNGYEVYEETVMGRFIGKLHVEGDQVILDWYGGSVKDLNQEELDQVRAAVLAFHNREEEGEK